MKVKEANKEKFKLMIYSLMRAIKDDAERCAEMCGGVTEKDMTVIGFVGQKKNVKMSDIAENIDAPMSTLTKIIDRLVERNILIREHSSNDRRAINVTLSKQGEAFYKSLGDQKKQVAETLLSQYDEKEQELFLKHLSALITSLAKK
jgi:DNA-binding MarR family transcriptional regulator